MRYRFRGKRIGNGEWVYGYLIGNDVIVGEIVEFNDEYFNCEFWYKVDPKTVGQYTGLKDKNGKEIYEGDILHERYFVGWSREKGERYVDVFAVVVWHDGGFTLKPIGKEHIKTLDLTRYEIAGDIHDQPHLLKGDENE